MTDLITRLSKLDAPDREVDMEIAETLGIIPEGYETAITTKEAECAKYRDYAAEKSNQVAGLQRDNEALTARIKELELSSKHSADVASNAIADMKALQADNKRLREALKFYADISKYPSPLTGGVGELWADCGAIARAALEDRP